MKAVELLNDLVKEKGGEGEARYLRLDLGGSG